MDEGAHTCGECGRLRPAEGACPHCGAVAGWDWPVTPPPTTGPATAGTTRPGPGTPPPAPDLSAGATPAAGSGSGNSGCGRVVLVVALVFVVLMALGAIGLFVLFRSVGDAEVNFDIDEGGTIEFDGSASYGDDPVLDGLWDDCEGGDMGACDDLYFQAPFGSEYEEFGDTCGGRREPGGICDQ
ncbi:hypothetical protein [Salsipaludibacter albus]|uniref:hypothetical protein n=1 Tax=Salsipaludibacter albus TaxID=2849650 RepID=UPI001EE3DBA6|nr:hypothetical protein [Salsipaludibacter albus]MBY5161989.1 hypothetical protein [Salsipaludibacter albus]